MHESCALIILFTSFMNALLWLRSTCCLCKWPNLELSRRIFP